MFHFYGDIVAITGGHSLTYAFQSVVGIDH
jgi:hypothetical protein